MDFENENLEGQETDAGQETAVESQQVDLEQQGEGGSAESGAEGSDASGAGSADRQAEQDRKFNSAMRSARLQGERDGAERANRERDAQIAALGIPNPYKPGAFFEGLEDLKSYGNALRRSDAEKRAAAQGRNVDEVLAEDEERSFVRKQMAKESASAAAADAQRRQTEFIAKDLAAFQARHPDVDVAALDGNQAFRRFAGSRYGKEPLADLYDDFLAIAGEAGKAAVAKQASRSERGTGAGGGGGDGMLTAAQRAELRAWNAENPEMEMTEKEFLER